MEANAPSGRPSSPYRPPTNRVDDNPLPEAPMEYDGNRTLTEAELIDSFTKIHKATRLDNPRSPRPARPPPPVVPTEVPAPPPLRCPEWIKISGEDRSVFGQPSNLSSFDPGHSVHWPRNPTPAANAYESPNQLRANPKAYPDLPSV